MRRLQEPGTRVLLDLPCEDSEVGSGDSGSNVTYHSVDGSELGATGIVIGIIMGLCSSVLINTGQNLQANGLTATPEAKDNPCQSKTWRLGLLVFIIGSFGNFAAFTFAPASVLVPLEAVQFVTNVVFNKCINKVTQSSTATTAAVCSNPLTHHPPRSHRKSSRAAWWPESSLLYLASERW
jgi:hypothetical protein